MVFDLENDGKRTGQFTRTGGRMCLKLLGLCVVTQAFRWTAAGAGMP